MPRALGTMRALAVLLLAAAAAVAAGPAEEACLPPRCGAALDAKAVFLDDRFEFEEAAPGAPAGVACEYRFYTLAELLEEFRGEWFVFQGASVTHCLFVALQQLAMPAPLEVPFKGHEYIDLALDADGRLLWLDSDKCLPPHDRCTDRAIAATAHVNSGEAVLRFTFFRSRMADEFPAEVARAEAAGWPGRRTYFFSTNIQYAYCYKMKSFCRFRPELRDSMTSEAVMLQVFEAHWKSTIAQLSGAAGGTCERAGVTCVVATADFFSPKPFYHAITREMNRILRALLESHAELVGARSILLVDNYALSYAAQAEVLNGHPSHFLSTWQYQRMLHAVRAAREPPAPPPPPPPPRCESAPARTALSFAPECYRRTCTGDSDPPCPGPSGFARMVMRRCAFESVAAPAAGRVEQPNPSPNPSRSRTPTPSPIAVRAEKPRARAEGGGAPPAAPHKARWTLWNYALAALTVAVLTAEGRRQGLLARDRPAAAAAPAAEASEKPPASPRRLSGLGVLRYVASLHVALTHLSRRGDMPRWRVLDFGYTWVPWFFMLSGFVLTRAGMRKAPQRATLRGSVRFLLRRLRNVYPLYVAALGVALALSGSGVGLRRLRELWAQSLLLQSWAPQLTERCLQMHCWFLSSIALHWLLFPAMLQALNRLTPRSCALLLLPCTLPGLLPLLAPRPDWYQAHATGATTCAADLYVVALKFHPFAHLHTFAFGMLLARAADRLGDKSRPHPVPLIPWLARRGHALGALALLAAFCAPGLAPRGHKLGFRLGALNLLQAPLLLASCDVHPQSVLSPLFAGLDWLGDYAYAQYLLQFAAFRLWRVPSDPFFPLFLFAASVLFKRTLHDAGARAFDAAAAAAASPRGRALAAAYALLPPLAFLLLSRAPPAPESAFEPRITALAPPGAVDMALLSDASQPCAMINPSLLFVDSRLLVAARCHALSVAMSCEGFREVSTTTWASELFLGELDPDSFALRGPMARLQLRPPGAGALLAGGRWRPCQAPKVFHPGNNTYSAVVATGPEDPRLFLSPGGKVKVTVVSRPPAASGAAACDPGQSSPRTFVAPLDLRGAAPARAARLRPQAEALAFPLGAEALGFGGGDAAEKNIGAFASGGAEYFVYRVAPLVVCGGPEGAVHRHLSMAVLVNQFLAAHALGEAFEVHGGSNPVRVPRSWVENAGGDSGEVFLGVAHLLTGTSRRYINFLYAFEAEPPFRPVDLSDKLDLAALDGPGQRATGCGADAVFASGLAYMPTACCGPQRAALDYLVLSYTVCDAVTRVRVMGHAQVRALFLREQP